MNEIKPAHRPHNTSTMTIGVAFDGVNVAAGLIDDQGRVAAVRRAETSSRTTRSAATAMTRLIVDVASARERGNNLINAVSLSVPGVVDPSTERVSITGLKGWRRVALRRMIEDNLKESGHDIRTPTDEKRARAQLSSSPHPSITTHSRAACRAAAESWRGAARGKSYVVYFYLDEAVEIGVLVNGNVLIGADGFAGAGSWLCVTESFKPEYAARGSLATEATKASVARRALEEWGGNPNSMLGKLIKADPAGLDAEIIIRAARGGDKLAVKIIDQTCRWIGRASANLISLVNPEALVIGGGFGLLLRPFLDQIREETKLWAAPEAARQCRIVNASLRDEAEIIGAARLAKE